jgi:hypothetical protein
MLRGRIEQLLHQAEPVPLVLAALPLRRVAIQGGVARAASNAGITKCEGEPHSQLTPLLCSN